MESPVEAQELVESPKTVDLKDFDPQDAIRCLDGWEVGTVREAQDLRPEGKYIGRVGRYIRLTGIIDDEPMMLSIDEDSREVRFGPDYPEKHGKRWHEYPDNYDYLNLGNVGKVTYHFTGNRGIEFRSKDENIIFQISQNGRHHRLMAGKKV